MSARPISNYVRDITLIERDDPLNLTPVGEGVIQPVNNNLDEFFLKAEITNTGNVITDNARITLRLDGAGTFIRAAPILTDENAKFKYVIDFQIDQNGIKTKLFRFEISQAIITEDENFGEVLIIVGRGREYAFKEGLTSRPLFFVTPNEAFEQRMTDYASLPLTNNPQLGTVTNGLPDDDSLKQNWIPSGATTIHQTLEEIFERTALPGTSGGVLRDFYWDSDASPTTCRTMNIVTEEFGTLPVADGDRVVIDPRTLTEAEQKDKVTVTDSITYKDQIILRGNATKGTLPMAYSKFASNYEHARRRDEWDGASVSYEAGDLVQRLITAAVSGESNMHLYFEAKTTHTSGAGSPPEINPTDWKMDFNIYPNFISKGSYEVGQIVSFDTGPNHQFFQVNLKKTSNPDRTVSASAFAVGSEDCEDPDINSSFSDFSPIVFLTADFAEFVPFSPWTNNADNWLTNVLDVNLPDEYIGAFVDWNFVRADYSTPTSQTNQYEHITHKWVTRESNNPGGNNADNHHGQRFLVGTAPTGTFSGFTSGTVAELDQAVSPEVWRESKNPVGAATGSNDLNDVITDMNTGTLRQFDGTNWINAWEANANNDTTSPIHPIQSINYIAAPGNEGIANQGLEFVYDWKLAIEGGDDINRASRGAWINFWYPFPRRSLTSGEIMSTASTVAPVGTTTIGTEYGGTGFGTLHSGNFDTNNLDTSANRLRGWNNGLDSEDLGRISAIGFKLKLRLEDILGAKINLGFANMPMIFFAVDIFDRVYQSDFTLKRVDAWEHVIIPFGFRAPKKLYFNRINEVLDIAGTVPFGNSNLDQKEFTGVQFDWRFVKMWGIQWKFPYDDANRYVNNFLSTAENLGATVLQYLFNIPQNLFVARDPDSPLFAIDKAKIAISDLRYIKELYVNSENAQVDDARTKVVNQPVEIDYNTAKLSAQGSRERSKFFPQTIHVRSFGDVRLRVGHRFLLRGDKVPNGEQEMVVQSIKHIIDATSYKMDVEAKRKFVIP